MTEEEAKTKWCPFIRFSPCEDSQFTLTNRGVGLGVRERGDIWAYETRCLGSACMAWCWDVEMSRSDPEVDHGYCGLAVKSGH